MTKSRLIEITTEQLEVLGLKGLYPVNRRSEQVSCGSYHRVNFQNYPDCRQKTLEFMARGDFFPKLPEGVDSFYIADFFQFRMDTDCLDVSKTYASVLMWELQDGKELSFSDYVGHQ